MTARTRRTRRRHTVLALTIAHGLTLCFAGIFLGCRASDSRGSGTPALEVEREGAAPTKASDAVGSDSCTIPGGGAGDVDLGGRAVAVVHVVIRIEGANEDDAAYCTVQVHRTRTRAGAVESKLATVLADERGRVVIRCEPGDTLDVLGWYGTGLRRLSTAHTQVVATAERSEWTIPLQLEAVHRLRGLVLDAETLAPVVGALVHCTGEGPREFTESTSAKGEFDVSGSWSIGATSAQLEIEAPGYSGRYEETPSGVSEYHVVLLRPSAKLTGTVLDENQREVADADVVVYGSGALPGGRGHARSDTRGRFAMDGLPSGIELQVDARTGPDQSVFARTHVTLAARESKDVRIVPRSLVELSGRVVDANGTSITSGQLTWRNGRAVQEATVRSDGTYYLPFVEPGEGIVQLEGSDEEGAVGVAPSAVRVDVSDGAREARVDLRFDAAANWVRGRVMNADGTPASGLDVRLESTEPGWCDLQTPVNSTTDEAGRFSCAGAYGGRYDVFVDGSPTSVRSIAPGADEVVVLRPGVGSVRGRLVASRLLGSIRGRMTRAEQLVERPWVRLTGDKDVLDVERIGADGSFTLPSVPEGTWNVTAGDENLPNLAVARTVRVLANGEHDLGDVELVATSELIVLCGSRQPRARLDVIQPNGAGIDVPILTTWIGAGVTRLDVPTGAVIVRVDDGHGVPVEQRVTVTDEEPAVVRFAPR